jgi:glycosyltransferase involved in cell wall biosynthesis
MKLKIAIVVHGRFHAFDLARALIESGHLVTVFTNYPKWAAERFGLPRGCIRSYWLHGGLSRAAWKLDQKNLLQYPESWLHTMFGRWAADEIEKENWDVVHLWSGVSEDTLKRIKGRKSVKLIMRGSAHIKTQARVLEAEEGRTGVRQDRPSQWMIEREQREYELADVIVTLSTFAFNSFIGEGVHPAKLVCLPLGANLSQFRPSPETVEARCHHILSGAPLRVLYVGALTFQKGMYDFVSIVGSLATENFHFRCVGQEVKETESLLAQTGGVIEIIGKRPQNELPRWYAEADVFMFPTIQDGYAVVLAQAHSSALPILTTTNCGGPDLIESNKTGWILPIRSPRAFIERLRWCDGHREDLAAMVRHIYQEFRPRTWSDVAADFESLCSSRIQSSSIKTTSNGN